MPPALPEPPEPARRALGRGTPWSTGAALLLTVAALPLTLIAAQASTHQREAVLLLADTGAAAGELEALLWRGGDAGAVARASGALRGQALSLRAAAGRDGSGPLRWLHNSLDPEATQETGLEEVATRVDALLAAAQGGRGPALRPAAAGLQGLLTQERAHHEAEERRAAGLTALLGSLTPLLALLGILGLLGQLRRSRRRALLLERERRTEREREERDQLTGLWNRRGLWRRYGEWSEAGPLSVVALDLNRLKTVNDTGGHAAGDAWLRQVAGVLHDASAPQGLAARWGGDEFVLLLPGTAPAQAAEIAAAAAARLTQPGDALPPFAHGVVPARPGDALERVLALADAAMYEHKERQREALRGRARTEVLGPSVEEFTSRLEQLETPAEVLDEGLALARALLEFQGSAYFERAGEAFVLRELGGEVPGEVRAQLEGHVYTASTSLTGRAIATGTVQWSNDYPNESGALPDWVAAGLKSALVVPVRASGRTVALVALVHFRSWRVVTPQARRLAQALAARLGHTLERLQAVDSVRQALQGGLLALGVALEERDLETAGHTERVVNLAEKLGGELGLSAARLDALRQGASLHDIGKLVIPDAILLKPGKLDPDEWAVMQNHAARGYEIAHRLSGLPAPTLKLIRHHHEKWDGSGYPDALAGEAIPLEARIFTVCDVYDALTHARPYKHAWTHAEAVAEIRAQSGKAFDPAVVDAFLDLIETARAGQTALTK